MEKLRYILYETYIIVDRINMENGASLPQEHAMLKAIVALDKIKNDILEKLCLEIVYIRNRANVNILPMINNLILTIFNTEELKTKETEMIKNKYFPNGSFPNEYIDLGQIGTIPQHALDGNGINFKPIKNELKFLNQSNYRTEMDRYKTSNNNIVKDKIVRFSSLIKK